MLDRAVIADLVKEEMEEQEMKLPRNMNFKKLVETFCLFMEDDYYEWFKDNYKSFFNHGNPDWKRVRMQIQKCKKKEP